MHRFFSSYFRSLEDFGDGGAYPEIHVAQYPMNLGRPEHEKNKKSKALAVQLDAEGKVKYDVIARQGHGKDKIVYRYLFKNYFIHKTQKNRVGSHF